MRSVACAKLACPQHDTRLIYSDQPLHSGQKLNGFNPAVFSRISPPRDALRSFANERINDPRARQVSQSPYSAALCVSLRFNLPPGMMES